MLQKPIPHSKKIGIIGLGTLFVLGVFLLPMARAGVEKAPAGIQEAPAEVAKSGIKNVKDTSEIEAIKASIESLQLAIQMKLDELHEKQAELELLREALNVKINGRGGSATTPNSTGFVFAAVKPSDAGSSPAGSRGKQSGGWVAIRSNGPGEPGVKPSGVGPSPAGSRGKQPSGGMMMAAVPGSSPAQTPGSQPTGGRVPAAFSMPRGLGVGQGNVLDERALAKDISDEVRKELQRILPGLLREMLPKLLKEAQTKTVESPSLIEQF